MSMFNQKIIKNTFLILLAVEILSFLGWAIPVINPITFILILLTTLILSLKKIEYGLYIIFAELFIGSYGYIFSFDLIGAKLSIRIGLFLVIMAVWVSRELVRFFRQINPDKKEIQEKFKIKKEWWLFGIVLLWAFVWGIIRGNNFGNVFLDFNNWLYFLLILPILSIYKRENFKQNLISILTACVIWMAIKSLLLLYIFTHGFTPILPSIYKWVRDLRVGEITYAGNGFWRIFIQSQIYSLFLFFIILTKNKLQKTKEYVLPIICLSIILLSLSRSYWVSLLSGLFFYLVYLIFNKINFLKIIKKFSKILLIIILSVVLIFVIFQMPPKSNRGDLGKLLGKRMSQSEAASSSRINQLKPLFTAISKHPVIGSGFGASLTYISNDPRVLSTTAGESGEYTTYSFEWGYLDMWLKFGLAGLFIYLLLIFKIIKRLYIKKEYGFILALISLLIVNIFSPYLNHPLGIGFILLALLFSYERQ